MGQAPFQCSSVTHALLCLRAGSCSVLRQGQPSGPVVSKTPPGLCCTPPVCWHTVPVLGLAAASLPASPRICQMSICWSPLMYLPHSNPNLQYTPCRFDQLGYTLPYKVNVADFILDIASSDVYTEDRCVHGPRCSRMEPAVAMLSGSMCSAALHEVSQHCTWYHGLRGAPRGCCI